MQIKTETKVGLFVIVALTLFISMMIGIGAFRISTSGYYPFTVFFDDVSGLSQKAEVKIAGVKVGWVEKIELTQEGKAQTIILINKKYILYGNAYAIIRQEGLIGTKYLELIPGDPMLPQLSSGGKLAKPGREAASIDELLFKFKNIANHVEEITNNIKNALSGPEKSEQLQSLVENISSAAEKINRLTGSLDRVISGNEDVLDEILKNIQSFTKTLKNDLPELKDTITKNINDSMESISRAADQARDGFSSIASVSQKIDTGQGLIGKLINEEEMYHDIKYAISGMKNYLNKFESLGVIVDSHSETMQRPVDQFKFTDTKGYFNIRVHTNSSFFYLAQVATSARGFVSRNYTYREYLDSREHTYCQIPYEEISTDPQNDLAALNRRQFAPQIITQTRVPMAFGFQFGKIYENLALRFGLFEGAFGAGADFYIPIKNDQFAWITTLEIFDMHGLQRLEINEQRRPHLKWLNKVFAFNNLYITFGADDFVSHNASMFWGFGLRFADDDIKYLLSKIGLFISV